VTLDWRDDIACNRTYLLAFDGLFLKRNPNGESSSSSGLARRSFQYTNPFLSIEFGSCSSPHPKISSPIASKRARYFKNRIYSGSLPYISTLLGAILYVSICNAHSVHCEPTCRYPNITWTARMAYLRPKLAPRSSISSHAPLSSPCPRKNSNSKDPT
jgi:hypothetical protein